MDSFYQFFLVLYISLIAFVIIHTMKNYFKQIIYKLYSIMADINEFKTALAEANEATNEIAADIESLKQQIENGGLSSLDEADVLAQLQAHASRLKGIANPTAPDGANGAE